MKNNIKKIITLFSFLFLLLGNSALASVTWNTASNDCPTIAVANWTTQTGYGNPCWPNSTVNASAGDFINVRVYYHNTGSTNATNTHISINTPSGSSATHSFSGQITSDGGNLSFGPATVNISSSQTLTWATTYWYPNQSQTPAALPNGQSGQEVINGGLDIGTIAPGWSSQGSVVIGFQVSNSTPPASCVINSFTANPSTINSGGSSVLVWNTTGCTNVSISGLGNVNPSGSQTVSPTQTTSYVMLASDSAGRQSTRTVTVTVNPVQNCTINSFTANPTSINQGGSSTLSWSTSNCTSVTISNLGYNVPTSGTQVIYPTGTTTYTLTAYGQNSVQQTQSVTVTVNQVQNNCSITYFTANPSSVISGNPSILSWATNNCVAVSISPNIGSVNNSGSQTVYPTQTTTYTLTAYGAGYWVQQTQSVTITVQQQQNNCSIGYFTANPNSINQGGSSTLSWSTSNCTSVTISNLGYNVPTSGTQVIYPTGTTTYTLTAYGQNGVQQTQSVTVTVNNYNYNNCSISYFNASPTSINSNSSSVLSWSTNNCNSVTISNLGYSVPFSGSQVVYPTGTTTYTLTAYGQNGVQQTQSVTVFVNNYNYNNCYISYFNASPTQINTGGSSNLTWSTSGCTSATISNLSYNISTAGSQVVYPTGTTTYTLTAYGPNYGSNWVQQTQSVTVYVNPAPAQNSCAVTTIPTNVTKNSATLNGTFSGSGISNAYFEYGSSTGLGYQTQARSVNGNTLFSDVISGLSSETIYYFRLVANCQNGISRGDLKVFQTLAPDVKPVIIQGTTIVGTSSPIMLKIENRSQYIKVGDTIYYTITYKNIGSKKLTHPIVQVVIPDGITFISSSRGVYSENTKTLNVPIEDLDPSDDGTIYLQARFDSFKENESEIVTTALLVYTNPKGAQENAIAYVLNNPEGSNSSLGALALFGKFWGLGLIGWLLIIIIILLLILIYRRYFSKTNTNSNTTENPQYNNSSTVNGHH